MYAWFSRFQKAVMEKVSEKQDTNTAARAHTVLNITLLLKHQNFISWAVHNEDLIWSKKRKEKIREIKFYPIHSN